jgi:hypothetical protein
MLQASLNRRKNALVKCLPDWELAPESGLFAANFFLDRPLDSLKEETRILFANIGAIASISEVIPENQLRGHFILQGKKRGLKVVFALSPENPPLIQKVQFKRVQLNLRD